jgi:hypothetical protein
MSLNLAPLPSSGPVNPKPVDLGVLASELDGGLASRAAIGLVVLATDQTLEHEFRALVRLPGVAFYEARVFSDNDITADTLRAIGPRIAPCVDLILPSIQLDVVGFGCTSATMTLGEEAVFAEIRKARPDVACTTPVTAALAAFKAFGAKGIGLLTPYAPQINSAGAALTYQPSPPSTGATTVTPPASRSHRSKPRPSGWPPRRGWMRSSYRAPAFVSRKRPPGLSSALACRSPPATTPWPGIACGSPA